jgi:hypothetical protein
MLGLGDSMSHRLPVPVHVVWCANAGVGSMLVCVQPNNHKLSLYKSDFNRHAIG